MVVTEYDLKKQVKRQQAKVIRCPRGMSEGAKKDWRRGGHALYDNSVLTLLNRTLLQVYCVTYAHYIDAVKKLKDIEDSEEKKVYQVIAEDYKETSRDR